MSNILVTGGAGFIGTHVVDRLLLHGHNVTVLDNFETQVHGTHRKESFAAGRLRHQEGDIRDRIAVTRALYNQEIVLHLAAQVGVGQSMYDMQRYVKTNTLGTAVLLEEMTRFPNIQKLVVASSMSCYGEGERDEYGMPLSTRETKPLDCKSIYAITKRDQEEMCLVYGEAHGLPVIALRLFNTYGPGQSLSNPYTGAAAIFAARCLNNNNPVVFEDGAQLRDFIHVHDVAKAFHYAAESDLLGRWIFNIGTGQPHSILELANEISDLLKGPPPLITHQKRAGDIRHCYASTIRAERQLDFRASVPFDKGIAEYVLWLQTADRTAIDKLDRHVEELINKGLLI